MPVLQKYWAISVNARSLLRFIDEFLREGLISQISIMLFLKNISINAYWYRSIKMLLSYPYASWNQILTENVTQSIRNMTEKLLHKKIFHLRLHFQIKQNFLIFQFLQCDGGVLFFEQVYLETNQVLILWKLSIRIRKTRVLIFCFHN